MKQYLNVLIQTKEDKKYINPLKVSQFKILRQIIQDNKRVSVVYAKCTTKEYKEMFGG